MKLKPNHISTYSLQIEEHTLLFVNQVKPIPEEHDQEMYDFICKYMQKNHYEHYEVSNFCQKGKESKHNLTYWNNEKYYGFGLGACGYLYDARYENTRSLNKYLMGEFRKERDTLDENEKIQNEFILGLRKIDGINKEEFRKKYKRDIKDIKHVKTLIRKKQLLENESNIYINPEYIYVSNDILVNFIDDLL